MTRRSPQIWMDIERRNKKEKEGEGRKRCCSIFSSVRVSCCVWSSYLR